MTTEKPRTLPEIAYDLTHLGVNPSDEAIMIGLEEAYALGAASRASPEEGRLRPALLHMLKWHREYHGRDDCELCAEAVAALRAPAPTETREEHFGPEGGRLITVGEQIAAGCAHISGGACMACVRRALAAEVKAFAEQRAQFFPRPYQALAMASMDPAPPPTEDEGAHCSQCGEPFTARACGPTHALIAAERSAPASSKEGGR